jgi:hypothetical protein
MTVDATGCGSDGTFTVYCGAIAGVGAGGAACPSGGPSQELPAGLVQLWASPYRLSDGEIKSGPRSVGVGGPAVYRICLYSRGYASNGAFGGTSLEDWLDTQPLPPEAELTEGQAVRAAKNALGRSFAKGTRRRIRCVEQAPGEFRCRARWRRNGKRRSAIVTVEGSPDSPVVTVRR